jgi:hypothetical protein
MQADVFFVCVATHTCAVFIIVAVCLSPRQPDVLCLQEVDHWRQIRDDLQDLG